MKEIALVATYPELAELGLQVAKEMNLDVIIKEGLVICVALSNLCCRLHLINLLHFATN